MNVGLFAKWRRQRESKLSHEVSAEYTRSLQVHIAFPCPVVRTRISQVPEIGLQVKTALGATQKQPNVTYFPKLSFYRLDIVVFPLCRPPQH